MLEPVEVYWKALDPSLVVAVVASAATAVAVAHRRNVVKSSNRIPN